MRIKDMSDGEGSDSEDYPSIRDLDSEGEENDFSSGDEDVINTSDNDGVAGDYGNSDDESDSSELHEGVEESDSSEDEVVPRNTVGDVPLEWYRDEKHIGYDIKGKKIKKKEKADKLQSFLASADDSKNWRKIYDEYNDEEVELTKEDIKSISRLLEGKAPHGDFDPYAPYVDWFKWDDSNHPLSNAPEPKRRFIPSKSESKLVNKIKLAIRKGLIKPKKSKEEEEEEEEIYPLWEDDSNTTEKDNHLSYIPAPKPKLPGHEESFNPSLEYIPTQEEINSYQLMYEEDRPKFIPKRFANMRSIPAYENAVKECFERCLDLYLCPRVRKKRLNIDPESLKPKLPSRTELKPYPVACYLEYRGHDDAVTSVSVEASGQWIASGSLDGTVRIWEVETGRCVKICKIGEAVKYVSWNPNPEHSIVAVSAGQDVLLLQTHPKVSSSAAKESCSNNNEEKGGEEKIMHYLSDQVDNAVRGCSENGEFPDIQFPKAIVKKVLQAKRKLLVEGSEDLLYSSNIAFQIAATIRRSLPGENDVHQGRLSMHITDEKGPSPKLIAEKLECYLNQLAKTSGLLVRACNGHLNFYSATKQASLYESAQTVNISKGSAAGSESKGCGVTHSSQNAPVKRCRLEIHLRRSSFDSEEYALYRRYQIAVHNDTPEHVTESSYKRFLVDTPLNYVPPKGDGTVPPCGFGSFHQQYVVDGKLIAVGVIDILPRCLSSKYLFWDPDFAFLSPGKYSALQEINWVKENQAHCSTLQYYYLGYYIHSCSKMRYKAAYCPSELLCPLRYQWIPFHIAKPLLDKKRYAVLSDVSVSQDRESLPPHVSEEVMEVQHDDIGKEDTNDFPMYDDEGAIDFAYESSDNEQNLVSVDVEDGNIGNILIGLNGSRVRFKDVKFAFGSSERSYLEFQLHRYMRVVGEELAERMVYSLE